MLAGRRAVRATMVIVIFGGIPALGFAAACGVDLGGTLPDVIPAVDAGVDVRPMPPPRGDSSMPPTDAAVDAPPGCGEGLAGPLMVAVGDGGDAGFCIDSTEVTNAQYDVFLAATDGGEVDAGGLPLECAALATYERRNGVGTPVATPGGPDHPTTYVEWCAAYGYCKWAGKRLCAKAAIAGSTGDAGRGEWYRACSLEGTRRYPYGDSLVPAACNQGNPLGAIEAVRSRPSCEGGVPGLFDMAGNASEWVDSCDGVGNCSLVGGYFGTGDGGATCRASEDQSILLRSDALGFRCCASPP